MAPSPTLSASIPNGANNNNAAALFLQGVNSSAGSPFSGLDSTTAQALLKQQEDQLRATRLLLQQKQLDELIASGAIGAAGNIPSCRSNSLLSRGSLPGLEELLAASGSSSGNPASRSTSLLARGPVAGLLSLSAAAAGQDSFSALVARRASANAAAQAMEAAASKIAAEEEEAEEDDGLEDEEYFHELALKTASEEVNSDGTAADADDKAGNESFPHKLYRMLYQADKDGLGNIVSFLPSGRGFTIHKPKDFVAEVMPRYFTTRRIASFQRQLNLYGFRRISEGREKGGYFHKDFMQGKRNRICRIKRKSTTARPTSAAFANRFGPGALQYPGAAASSLYGPGLLAGPSNASKELLLARFGQQAPQVHSSNSAAASLLDLTRTGLLSGAGGGQRMGASHQDILRNAAASLLWTNGSNGGARQF